MIYRVAVLSAVLLAAMGFANPAYAADADKIQSIKGQCVNESCDSVNLTSLAAHKNHMVIMFLRGNQKVRGFSGTILTDYSSGNMIVTDHIRFAEGVADEITMMTDHIYRLARDSQALMPDGTFPTTHHPAGWETHQGSCNLYFKHLGDWIPEGPLIAIECGQPPMSFKATQR